MSGLGSHRDRQPPGRGLTGAVCGKAFFFFFAGSLLWHTGSSLAVACEVLVVA